MIIFNCANIFYGISLEDLFEVPNFQTDVARLGTTSRGSKPLADAAGQKCRPGCQPQADSQAYPTYYSDYSYST